MMTIVLNCYKLYPMCNYLIFLLSFSLLEHLVFTKI